MRALLGGKSAAWLDCRPEPDAFSPLDVLGHLIFADMTDWIPRARIILERQNSRHFEPFDRRGFAPILEGRSVEELLDRFAAVRSEAVRTLESFDLDERQLDLPGLHPDLGQVTLRQLIATWVVHDLGHLAQVARTMAGRYRDAVGAWRAYLPILKS